MKCNFERALLFFVALVLFCGCSSIEDKVEENHAQASLPAVESMSNTYTQMLERSIASKGNNRRVQSVIERISSGEPVTIGFIGGSITEGFHSADGKNYAQLVTDYLDKTYSDGSGKVRCLNTGIAGTSSMLGLIRCERELLSKRPDLIFIEFAVNDAQSFTDKQAFEGLVRKCLLLENEPAVVLLYSVTENGYSCQNDMAMTAFYYDLPAISVRDAIMPEITSGNMKWSDWSDDEVHPHEKGHVQYCQFITNLIDTLVSQDADEDYKIPSKCRFSTDWSRLKEYDNRNLPFYALGDFEESPAHAHFQNAYSYNGIRSDKNSGLSFQITGKTLFLVYKASPLSSYGTAEVLVDGEVIAHLNAYAEDAWNNPVTQLIYSSKNIEAHEIMIRMQPGDEGKRFDLLSIGVVQE